MRGDDTGDIYQESRASHLEGYFLHLSPPHTFPAPELWAALPGHGSCNARSGQQGAPRTCAVLAVPVQPALPRGTGTLVAARSVDAAKAAASPVDAALVHIWGKEKADRQQRWAGAGAREWELDLKAPCIRQDGNSGHP